MSGPSPAAAPRDPAVASSMDEYRVVAEHSVDPLFHAFDGVVHWVGPSVEAILGWSQDEMAAMPLVDLCHPDDVAGLEQLLGRVTQADPRRGVFRLAAKGGDYLWILVSLGAGIDEEGRVGVVGSMREINLRVRAERELRLIADHASDVLFTADPDRRVTWVSPNLSQVLGWGIDEMAGAVVDELCHPADRVALVPHLSKLLAGSEDVSHRPSALLRVRRRDGGYLWMQGIVEVLRDRSGNPEGLLGRLLDVDDLAQARERIRADARFLRTVLDSMLDAHAVLRPVRDDSGRIVDFIFEDVNETACTFLGTSRDETLGTLISERLPGNESSGLTALYARAMETGEPLVMEDFEYPDFELTGTDRRFDIRAVRFGDSLSLIWRDVTQQRKTIDALAASEEKYRLLAENVSDVVMRDRDSVIEWVSPSLTTMLGWAPSDWIGLPLAENLHPADRPDFEAGRAGIEAGPLVQRYRVRDRDGRYHWVEEHASTYLDVAGTPAGAVASFRTIDREMAALGELERRARHDELTGLINRKEVLERLSTLGGPARRSGDEYAVLFCDVDRFKSVNDAHGHAIGDVVLRSVAARINASIRSGDVAARIGGDEMLVILGGIHGMSDAVAVAESIRRAVEEPIDIDEDTVSTSVSIGVALVRPGESIDELVARADDAMFRAKAAGRNQVVSIDVEVT